MCSIYSNIIPSSKQPGRRGPEMREVSEGWGEVKPLKWHVKQQEAEFPEDTCESLRGHVGP